MRLDKAVVPKPHIEKMYVRNDQNVSHTVKQSPQLKKRITSLSKKHQVTVTKRKNNTIVNRVCRVWMRQLNQGMVSCTTGLAQNIKRKQTQAYNEVTANWSWNHQTK